MVSDESLSVEKRKVVSDLSRDERKSAEETQLDPPIDWGHVTSSIVAGDPSAFAVYYESYFDLMLKQARRLCGMSAEDCVDLVHDAMLKAGKSMKPITDCRSLEAWSRAVVYSVCLDRLRKSTRERNWLRVNQHYAKLTEDQADSASLGIAARLAWIESSLENLPADLRQLFSWRFRLGWSLKAIGRQLGISTGAVDGRMRRAIDTLREQAIQEFGDEF